MSHDQKPVKVRLLDTGGEKARRRGDTPPIIVDGNAPPSDAVPTGRNSRSGLGGLTPFALGGRAGRLLVVLFVLGCGIGGATIAGLLS